jgi:glycosyltransferase involved in cell wall biosynthesis
VPISAAHPASTRPAAPAAPLPTTIGMLSTYPPTQCGLATFSAALIEHLQLSPGSLGVVRVVDQPEAVPGPDVVGHLVNGSAASAAGAVRRLNGFDTVVVQHEYGIYGGPDGDQVLDVFDELTVPLIVVLHTVLIDPTPHQREVLEGVIDAADAVVVMTPTARRRLLGGYSIDPRRVVLIPHGAPDNRARPSTDTATPAGRPPTILTWGLIGPGKGIEWGIDALAELADLDTSPRYLVVGETHPKVVEREGEAYRHALNARAVSRGVDHLVEFDARYLDSAALASIVREADVVLLPYDSREQVTSGVLVEALAAGKPVIATGFPHAVEMLAGGAGLIVPHADAPAIAHALRRVLSEPGVAEGLAAEASALADELLWPAVAGRYQTLAATITAARQTAVA